MILNIFHFLKSFISMVCLNADFVWSSVCGRRCALWCACLCWCSRGVLCQGLCPVFSGYLSLWRQQIRNLPLVLLCYHDNNRCYSQQVDGARLSSYTHMPSNTDLDKQTHINTPASFERDPRKVSMGDGNRTGLCQLLLVVLVVVLLVLPVITSIVSLLYYLGFQDKSFSLLWCIRMRDNCWM